jgi:uncharacterized repeat protein (TIGR03803 family)
MSSLRRVRYCVPCLAILVSAFFLLLCAGAQAQVETVLHTFQGLDGEGPEGELTFDASGDLYGTTNGGGEYGSGTVFEISPVQGGWNFQVLYSFTGGADGLYPIGALISDSAGNLYGVTQSGGSSGNGTVFQLSPPVAPGTSWTETVLYSFGAFSGDGTDPLAGLVFDAGGNLYGTTALGGGSSECPAGCGAVYELTPSASGSWTETLLYSFQGVDGFNPRAQLVFDEQGDLFGTTAYGGRVCQKIQKQGCGTVFELTPSQGTWVETTIHFFHGPDGYIPESGVTIDSDGNLYGTTLEGGLGPCDGGSSGCGTVFRMSPGTNGWSFTTLHIFGGEANNDGAEPIGRLTIDKQGRLYGATANGGNGWGTVYQLRRSAGGIVESVYGKFGPGPNGEDPNAGVTLDQEGNVYGTTFNSYPAGEGVVFELTR